MKITYLCSLLVLCLTSCTFTDQENTTISPCFPEFREDYSPVGSVSTIRLGNGKTVMMDEDSTFFLGDLLLSKSLIDEWNSPATKSAAISTSVKLWNSPVINYYISPSFSNSAKTVIRSGVQMLNNANLCIQFVENSSIPSSGLYFIPDSTSNYSYIGKQTSVNQVHIYYGNSYAGIVAHEVMHALGFFHEQSRTDRNNYVVINYNNIQTGKEHNFNTFSNNGYSGYNIGAYDYYSIMHYGSYYFSNNSLPTITKLDGATITPQRSYLTSGDIAGLKYLYGPRGELSRALDGGEAHNINDYYIDEISDYSYSLSFRDSEGEPTSLQYPRLYILDYCVTEQPNSNPNSITEQHSTVYITVPSGSSEYYVGGVREHIIEEGGIVLYYYSETYNLLH